MMVKKTKENSIEMYTRWYLEELVDYGYIKSIEREPETIVCADPFKHQRVIRHKTKKKIEEFNLLPKIVYTYDTRVIWTDKAKFIFFDDFNAEYFQFGRPLFVAQKIENDWCSMIDTKAPSQVAQKSGKVGSSRDFTVKRHLIAEKHGVFIEKFVPIPNGKDGITVAKFPNSFTPRRFLFTDSDKMNRHRKINYKPIRTIESFVELKLAYILEQLKREKQYK